MLRTGFPNSHYDVPGTIPFIRTRYQSKHLFHVIRCKIFPIVEQFQVFCLRNIGKKPVWFLKRNLLEWETSVMLE